MCLIIGKLLIKLFNARTRILIKKLRPHVKRWVARNRLKKKLKARALLLTMGTVTMIQKVKAIKI
jgi:hypothetical protein